MHALEPWRTDEKNGNPRAIMAGERLLGCVYGDDDDPVAVGNARLIAAAPDLLVALKRILIERSVCSGALCDIDHVKTCRYYQARAAIQKAEGR